MTMTSRVESFHQAVEYCFEQGWSDGLPVVPPTEELIGPMVEASGLPGDTVVGEIPPINGVATVEKLAINAVMAGCKPEYFPAVIAGVRALLEPRFNLHGVQTTTHASVPLLIVNGPVRDRIGINYRHGVFGNGYRANGTIGRAIRLIQWNIGGSFPGDADQSTFAHPGKWTYCIGEWEEASPWEPFHVERGFSPETSTVTAFACDPPLTIRCHGTAKQILSPICQTMAIMGPNNLYYMGEVLLVISPREAQTFGEEGWTKQQVREHIWNQARVPMYKVRDTGVGDVAAFAGRRWPDWVDPHDDNCMVPLTRRPEDIHVLVCGGWGRFAAVCFSWGDLGGFATTKAVE